jgi:hypothetical protein
MMFEAKLVESLVIEHAEFRCQATKRPDEPELRGDAIYDDNELDVRRELETHLSFTLHFGQRVSRREQIRVQAIATIRGVREVTDPVCVVETSALELARGFEGFRPGNDES